jgi:hypothetical protein
MEAPYLAGVSSRVDKRNGSIRLVDSGDPYFHQIIREWSSRLRPDDQLQLLSIDNARPLGRAT